MHRLRTLACQGRPVARRWLLDRAQRCAVWLKPCRSEAVCRSSSTWSHRWCQLSPGTVPGLRWTTVAPSLRFFGDAVCQCATGRRPWTWCAPVAPVAHLAPIVPGAPVVHVDPFAPTAPGAPSVPGVPGEAGCARLRLAPTGAGAVCHWQWTRVAPVAPFATVCRGRPVAPGAPSVPGAPGAPGAPLAPTAPAAPDAPVLPIPPVTPVAPVAPIGACTRGSRSAPVATGPLP